MAGFFGLFDYNKVGPGIDKNGPQKRGFVVFFEIYTRKFWKLIQASLFAFLLYIPVLTNGLASAGLTFVGRNYARQKHAFVFEDFKDTIKRNWKQALPVGIINLVLQILMIYAAVFYFPVSSEEYEPTILQYIAFSLMVLMNVLFIWTKYYIYMLMITFKFTLRQLYRNSVILAIAGLKENLIISLGLVVLYAILFLIACVGEIGLILAILLGLLLVPGFRILLIQYNIFPLIKKHIIDPYYKEHPDEDLKQRHDLAVEPTEEKKEDSDGEEVIFKDMGRTEKEDAPKEETPARKIPKQYTEEQLRRGRRLTRTPSNDDDDTI